MSRDGHLVEDYFRFEIGAEDKFDVLEVEYARVRLLQLQRLGERFASRYEETLSFTQGLAVDADGGTVGVGGVVNNQLICHVSICLRSIAQTQREVGSGARGDVAHHWHVNVDLWLLNLHGGFHDDCAGIIILGDHLTLVGLTGLSAEGAEDGAVVAKLVDVYRDGVVVVVH